MCQKARIAVFLWRKGEIYGVKEIAPTLLEEYERLKEELRPLQRPRPQWDIQLLEAVGFHSIQVDTTVWQRVYGKQDEFYNPTPIFTIVARK